MYKHIKIFPFYTLFSFKLNIELKVTPPHTLSHSYLPINSERAIRIEFSKNQNVEKLISGIYVLVHKNRKCRLSRQQEPWHTQSGRVAPTWCIPTTPRTYKYKYQYLHVCMYICMYARRTLKTQMGLWRTHALQQMTRLTHLHLRHVPHTYYCNKSCLHKNHCASESAYIHTHIDHMQFDIVLYFYGCDWNKSNEMSNIWSVSCI